MLKVYFWVEVATQLSGYQASVQAKTTAEMKDIILSLHSSGYDGYRIDPFSYELKKDGISICDGTCKDILDKLDSM